MKCIDIEENEFKLEGERERKNEEKRKDTEYKVEMIIQGKNMEFFSTDREEAKQESEKKSIVQSEQQTSRSWRDIQFQWRGQ